MTDLVPILIKPGVYLRYWHVGHGGWQFQFTKNIKAAYLVKRNSSTEQELYTELRNQGIL